jgi:hypothetical protein
MIEGYLMIQHNGRYAICNRETTYELTSGECMEVKIENAWIAMRIEHDGEGYYLLGDHLSFYPKQVYVRYDTSFRRF